MGFATIPLSVGKWIRSASQTAQYRPQLPQAHQDPGSNNDPWRYESLGPFGKRGVLSTLLLTFFRLNANDLRSQQRWGLKTVLGQTDEGVILVLLPDHGAKHMTELFWLTGRLLIGIAARELWTRA